MTIHVRGRSFTARFPDHFDALDVLARAKREYGAEVYAVDQI